MTSDLRQLIEAIAAGKEAVVERTLQASPGLAAEALREGATRAAAQANVIAPLGYAYAGDTALHFAAAAWRPELIGRLIALGADVAARNRRGATPLHYAAVGNPSSPRWNPDAQARAIAALIAAGADPNAADRGGTTPLHRAVRTRCAAAVRALLAGGADAAVTTKNGSDAAKLAAVTSGRGGSGSPQAKAQQAEIRRLLGAI